MLDIDARDAEALRAKRGPLQFASSELSPSFPRLYLKALSWPARLLLLKGGAALQ